MEHEQAITSNSAERYLLDELSDSDRELFEKHFFDCSICADDVRSGEQFAAAAKEVFREEPADNVVPMPPRNWTSWIPQAAAATLLIGVIGYQNAVTIPALRQDLPPSIPSQYRLDAGDSRGPGGAAKATTVHAGENALLWIEIPPRETAGYAVEVLDAQKKVHLSRAVSRDEAIDPIPLLIGELPAGSYVVVIQGVDANGNRSEITRHAFNVV